MRNDREGKERETALVKADMTFESWTRQKGESTLAYGAFCVFRDYGAERNIKRALLSVERDEAAANRKYRGWRNWAALYRWYERAGDYDSYLDKMKQAERRRVIAEREEAHRQITAKMMTIIGKKLDTMSPEELKQANVPDWVKTAIETERDVLGIANNGGGGQGQVEIVFDSDFEGI